MLDHAEVRMLLRRTWVAFFGRFGRLLPVQVQAVPPVLEGRNVVVCSPTASGKTEAVVAPTAERSLREGWGAMSVLYLTPTRALANDALLRIAGPLGDLGLSAALKHGDKPQFDASRPPDWLLTTPESLDSLLCRQPDAMARVRTVILDELHLVDGTYRGDQLRILLRRLRHQSTGPGFASHALSATLSDPEGVARRYMDDCTVVRTEGGREIDVTYVGGVEDVLPLARSRRWRKVLLFCNSRRRVEETARSIMGQWGPYPVVVHHGSLERRHREGAEATMREERVAACVCTSTLEVGVDIGDIDLVVLVEVPYSVSTLLQRLGRANRREDRVHVAFVAGTPEVESMARAMVTVAQRGDLPTTDYRPDLSVAVQQTLSLLYQYRAGVQEGVLADLLSPLIEADDLDRLLLHLRDHRWVTRQRDRWCASEKAMNLGERGHIHSNIPDTKSYKVIDVTTGRQVGSIAGVFDLVFVLNRRAWKVMSVKQGVIYATPHRGGADAALFVPHRNEGAFAHLLPADLRRRGAD